MHARRLRNIGGVREVVLSISCRTNCDGIRAVNNLIKCGMSAWQHPHHRPIHVIHIVETSRLARVENLKLLAHKMQ